MTAAADWIEQHLGYRFTDERLLENALRHRSADGSSNERLEFLGDAVLDSVISAALFERRPEDSEGALSRLRSLLVRDRALAGIARELGLGEHLSLGSGERKSGGYRRDSILADAVEALVGAIFLDGGYAAVDRVVRRLYSERLAGLPSADELKDPKTRLQEWLQGRGYDLPVYTLLATRGKPHEREFDVSCGIAQLELEATGRGASRRAAEQAAAAALLGELAGPER